MRQTGFTSLYVLAAVCAATGAMSAVIMPTLNTEVVNLFLEQFLRQLPAGVHAVLIWDGAGFHTGEDVVVPSNVSLIQLPPYSPELNPVENLWHYLRAHHWSNRLYRDYDALQEEAVRSLCAVREDTETIKTVCRSSIYLKGRIKFPESECGHIHYSRITGDFRAFSAGLTFTSYISRLVQA